MHRSQRVKASSHVVQRDPGAFGKRLQLSHRRRLDDIEDTKKYKGRQKRFPRERHRNQRHQLTSNLIDHHKLRIFYPRTPRDPRSRRNPDQHDEQSQGNCERSTQARSKRSAQCRPDQHCRRRSPGPRPRPHPPDAEKCGNQRSPERNRCKRRRFHTQAVFVAPVFVAPPSPAAVARASRPRTQTHFQCPRFALAGFSAT
jgi:hypothetical protein